MALHPSSALGKDILQVEVTNVSKHGFWILLSGEEELFVPFSQVPWFKTAALEAIFSVERPQPHHLYWPRLDIDLTRECIRHPEHYPLVSKYPRPEQASL
jgi:hypothetical protein